MGEMNKERDVEALKQNLSASRLKGPIHSFYLACKTSRSTMGLRLLFAPELDLGEGEKKAVQRTEPHWSRSKETVVRPPSSEPNVRRNPLLSHSSSLHQAFFWQ
ncbi:hypothetical protein HPP92_003972 [Vanilla planifolia]|uniref:Uncharacterized protein n=1 Tax=Vanilla planifolia TaxID=51239 RepID=A0A835S3Z9_VANPL|nr:hypothetical protein HPP92_003972 [Vanilla planifolia]